MIQLQSTPKTANKAASEISLVPKTGTIQILGTWFPLILNENPSLRLKNGKIAVFHRAGGIIQYVHLNGIRAFEASSLLRDLG